MRLSPKLYHYLIRPKWLTKFYIDDVILSYFNFNNKLVLDFGCGIGSGSSMVRPDGYLGVDPDPERISYAKSLYPEHNFHVLVGNNLPVPDNSIDYILIIAVLHHIPTGDIHDYLREFNRILKSDGKILVMEPCFFENRNLANRCMAAFDNGKYIRNMNEYLQIFNDNSYKVNILKQFKRMLLYNEIFFAAYPDEYNPLN
jgi:ubiquinone/menaquinone biosynthesis C-methylase UbiE